MNNTVNGNIHIPDNQAQYNCQPPQYLLGNWQLQIAKEMIGQWRDSPASPKFCKSAQALLESIDLTNQQIKQGFAPLSNKLDLEIQQKINITELNESIVYDNDKISLLFEQIAQELENILQNLANKNIEAIKNLFSVYWQEISPQKLKVFLEQLCENLLIEKNKFNTQRIEQLDAQTSAWQAYFILNQKLHKSSSNSLKYQVLIESMWRAITISFKLKLRLKFIEDYSQMIESLIILCHGYYELVNCSCKILDRIQDSLDKKSASSLDIISLPAFMLFNENDVWEQKNVIEVSVGHSINYWGHTSITFQEIEANLLKNVEIIILANYPKFWQFFHNYQDLTDCEQEVSKEQVSFVRTLERCERFIACNDQS